MSGSEGGDGLQSEFIAEAHEIIEALSRDLLLLDHGQKEGEIDPDLVNSVFRGVHTLKGIAGMFGFAHLGELAHQLEELLDSLRLGLVDLSQRVLDTLFEGIELLQRIIDTQGNIPEAQVQKFKASIDGFVNPDEDVPEGFDEYDLDASVLSVLTEYEEHRLRTNIDQGVPLYRLKVRYSLASIDTDLEEMKARSKPIAEIITYLPSMDGGDDDFIDLEIILASKTAIEEVRDVLVAGSDAELTRVAHAEQPPSIKTVPPVGQSASSLDPIPPPPVPPVAPPMQSRVEDVGADSIAHRSVAKTVRVDIAKLDHLMNVVGELSIVRTAVGKVMDAIKGQPGMRRFNTDLHRIHRQFERHLENLQDGILDVRMVPLGQTFDRLARSVRRVGRELGKEVRLVVNGADTEVDKLIVEELNDPLLHIIRNAIDHGIETAQERAQLGKATTGILALNAYQKGNHVVIEIEDDGAGMDEAAILASAVKRGVITAAVGDELTRDERLALIFVPGLSTAKKVTDLSGRGVGMDVVKTHISRLGGVVDVQSELQIGTKFTITLPITLAILSALVLRVAGRTFAVPLNVVQEAMVLERDAIRTIEGREVLTLRGATLPICRLNRLFSLEYPDGKKPTKDYVVVTALGQRRLGLVVEALEGQRDIIIKPLGRSLRNVRGFAGATDLGDQRVVLVLDAPGILEELLSGLEHRAKAAGLTV